MSTDQRTEVRTDASDPAGNPNAPAIVNDKSAIAVAQAKLFAGEMQEAKDMALHVVERLETALSLVAESNLEFAAQVDARVGAIAQDLADFLDKSRGKKTVFRLVYNREVMAKIEEVHQDIDKALSGLDIISGDSMWRKDWEGYREAHCKAFGEISKNRMKLMSDIRGDTQAQSQALGYLLYEYRFMTSKYTEDELRVLNKAFSEASKFSRNKTPEIHTWFLPPYEFECEDTPFTWGSFGAVYRGKYEGSNVAVKRVKIADERSRAAFIKEAEVWFKANKIPNVVRLYGAYHLDSKPYFVSEYAVNGTLSDFLQREANRDKTWKLLHDAAKGVRALHRIKILHNDLKCNNILVTSDFVAKLIDFGLSAQLSALQAPSVHKARGAYGWKANEVLSGEKPASYASDVYSFAMCIYEAVTRMPPYAGVADAMMTRNVKDGILPKRPDGAFTDGQWQLIVDMAALDPDKRIKMDEVIKRLAKFEEDEYNNHQTKLNKLSEESESNDSDNQCDDSRSDEGIDPETEPATDSPKNLRFDSTPATDAEHQVTVCHSPVETATSQSGDKVVTDAFIPKYAAVSAGKKGVEYMIVLRVEGGEEICIRRRYSDLRALRKNLMNRFHHQMLSSPPFPSRKPFWSRDMDTIAHQRCESLSKFVQFVIQEQGLPIGVSYGNNETAYTPGVSPGSHRRGIVLM